ncbi:MAG: dihydrodipicolinate synthase family protein [Bryobacteraceae bacterium]
MNQAFHSRVRGILPAIVSPHDGDDCFEPAGFLSVIDSVYAAGVQGLYVCGGTGEGYLMSLSERRLAAELAVEKSRERGAVIVHVGAQGTRDAAVLAEHAARCGADAVASIPPMGRSPDELVSYYRDIASASSLPTFVYHIPAVTHTAGELGTFLKLLEIPGVAGMKFTDSDLFLLRRVLLERPEAIIFSGSDELLFAGLSYGAWGGIGTWYNLFPSVFVRIFQAVQAADWASARDLQHRFVRFAHCAWSLGLLECFDAIARRLGHVKHVFRRPFKPFGDEEGTRALSHLAPLSEELGLML